MQCEYSHQVVEFLDIGDGPLATILSFLDVRDLPKTSLTCRYMNGLCEQEWAIRDAMLPAKSKSKATTPKERCQRLALGQETLDAATCSFLAGEPASPRHVILKPLESSETMLRLYSITNQSVLWEGFLPLSCNAGDGSNNNQQQQQSGNSIGWKLDVAPLSSFWSQMVKPLPTSAISSLEVVSQLVDDLVVILVDVSRQGKRPVEARLVTCTQGVALSQRQHTSDMGGIRSESPSPSTFVLRQQVVKGMPVVVHLSFKAHADVLDEINVSYFCLR